MYVSPAVRTIRDDPIPGESVTLVVETTDEADVDEVGDALGDVGTVEAELAFESLAVTVAHEDVAAVCEIPGIATVETSNTLHMDADGAGEDVRPSE